MNTHTPITRPAALFCRFLSVFICVHLWLLSPLLPDALAAAAQKPNIIFIMADDLGVDWVSAYGSSHPTPHIDRLAQQGVRFTTAWTNPICTPTRMTLLTGQYAFRHGWTDHHDVPRWGGRGFDPEKFTTFARILKSAGYATAIAGKWQINDLRPDPQILARHGFDEHCVWPGGESENPDALERYWNPFIQTNNVRKVHENAFGSDIINAFALDFIRRHRDQPFLLYYPMNLPHSPYIPTPLNKLDPPKDPAGRYAGMVTYLDHLVGNVVAAVDDLGLADRTLIIFTCDNGSSIGGHASARDYPPGKGKITNYGAHVPFIVRAPMLIKQPGRASDDLIDFTDILPTFAQLATAPLPSDAAFDGRSILPLLDGSASDSYKRQWIHAQRGDLRTVRDKRFKLDSTGAFWDLANDPLETRDLRDSADPTIAAARQRLAAVLASFPPDAGPPFAEFQPISARPKQPAKNRK